MSADGVDFDAAERYLWAALEAHEKRDQTGFVASLKMLHIALRMDLHLAPAARSKATR